MRVFQLILLFSAGVLVVAFSFEDDNEPKCYSRFDYDAKMLSKLMELDINLKQLTTEVADLETEIADLKRQSTKLNPVSTEVPPVSCREGWYSGRLPGTCFYVAIEPDTSWFSAQAKCVAMGANLASITTQEDMCFLKSNIPNWIQTTNEWHGLWIGGYDRLNDTFGEEGVWKYIDGSPWQPDVTQWLPGQPSHATENCAVMLTSPGRIGLLNDSTCTGIKQGYLCKMTPRDHCK